MIRTGYLLLIIGSLIFSKLTAQHKVGKMIPKNVPEHELTFKIDDQISYIGSCYCKPEKESKRWVYSSDFREALGSTLKKAGLFVKKNEEADYRLRVSSTWEGKMHYKLLDLKKGDYVWETYLGIPMDAKCEENMNAHFYSFIENLSQWEGTSSDLLSEHEILQIFEELKSGNNGPQVLDDNFMTIRPDSPLNSLDYGEYYLFKKTYPEKEKDSYWKYLVSSIKEGDQFAKVRSRFQFATYNFGIVNVYRESEQIVYNIGNWNRLIDRLQGAHSAVLSGGPGMGSIAEQSIWRGEGTRISRQGIPPEIECRLKFNFNTKILEETSCDVESWKNYASGDLQDYLLIRISDLEIWDDRIGQIEKYDIVGFAQFEQEKLTNIVVPIQEDVRLIDRVKEDGFPLNWKYKPPLKIN